MDDNATKRDVLAGLLKHWGCRYEDAPDAETALEKRHHAVDAGDPFHIAILDMLMPHTDGETLGRLIRDESAFIDTALVMMTSGGKRGDAGRLEQIGFDAYLTKPVRRAHLSDTLLTILGRTADYSAPSGLITRYSIDEDQRRKVRILLAEDNVIIQKVALKMLENMGYRGDAVANGQEAVTALQTIPLRSGPDGYPDAGDGRSGSHTDHSQPAIECLKLNAPNHRCYRPYNERGSGEVS